MTIYNSDRVFTDDETANVPVLSMKDVIKIRVHHFWNYPRSLEVSFDGVRYWAEETPFDSGRYVVLELSDDLWSVVDEMNADFRKYVGSHWEYNSETQRFDISDQHPHNAKSINTYYDKWLGSDVHERPLQEGYTTLHD